jgi:hypothetical protein
MQAFAAPADGAATVCVFRAHGAGLSVITPVSDNRQLVGATKGASYFCYGAEPGKHVLAVDDTQTALNAKTGERYYYYHEYRSGIDRLVRVTEGTAYALAGMSDYTELDEVPQGVAVPSAVAFAPAQRGPATVRVAANQTAPAPLGKSRELTAKTAPPQSPARAAR